jgi:hypothetical protein
MFELVVQRRACPGCGAGGDDAAQLEGRGGTFFEAAAGRELWRAPRERSGLAYSAGFAAVGYLFRYSLAPLALSQAGRGWSLAACMMFVWGLLAPTALALSFAAVLSLDRAPWKSGRLPALFGFIVGWFGLIVWYAGLDERWLRYLLAF